MAQRRMFTQEITDSDAFLEMPVSTQNLYFHLGMKCDDDGFCNKVRNVMTMCKANDDDYKLLIAKRFIIVFESGVMVIKHWRMHNYIQNDRYKETSFLEEKSKLYLKDNKSYTLDSAQGVPCIQNGYKVETQVRLGKASKEKDSKVFVVPTIEEIKEYAISRNRLDLAQKFFDYFESGNWIDSKGNKVKNWKQKFITWEQHNACNQSQSNTERGIKVDEGRWKI